MYGIFGRDITKYMVIYGVYKQFWPTPKDMYHFGPQQHPHDLSFIISNTWNEKKKNYAGSENHTPHVSQGKGATYIN